MTSENKLILALVLILAPAIGYATWDLQPHRMLGRIREIERKVAVLESRR